MPSVEGDQPLTKGRHGTSVSVLVSKVYPGTGAGFEQSDRLIFDRQYVPKLLITTSGSEGCDRKVDDKLRVEY